MSIGFGVTPRNGLSVLANSAATNVVNATLTTVVTFTSIGNTSITRINGSGTIPAKYDLVLNSTTIEIQRSGPNYRINFEFGGPLSLSDGDILDLKVTHLDPNNTRDFQATIYGV